VLKSVSRRDIFEEANSVGGSNKPSIKPKNPLRGSYGKLTLDLKNLKTDLKSIVPGTTVAHGK